MCPRFHRCFRSVLLRRAPRVVEVAKRRESVRKQHGALFSLERDRTAVDRRPLPIETVGEGSPLPKTLDCRVKTGGETPPLRKNVASSRRALPSNIPNFAFCILHFAFIIYHHIFPNLPLFFGEAALFVCFSRHFSHILCHLIGDFLEGSYTYKGVKIC